MDKEKTENGNGPVRKPGFPEIRKVAKELGIKAAGKSTEQLLEACHEEIIKKYEGGEFDDNHALVTFHNETITPEVDVEEKPTTGAVLVEEKHVPPEEEGKEKEEAAKELEKARKKKEKAEEKAGKKKEKVDAKNKAVDGKKKKPTEKSTKKNPKKEEKKKPTDVVVADKRLPATVEGLRDFIIVGKEKLKAQKAKIRAIEKVNLAYIAKAAALSDAQDLAEILLDAEVRLGLILRTDAESGQRATSSTASGRKLEDYGISKKESHQAQSMAKNVDVVDTVREEARNKGRIATSNDVLREIKKQKAVPKKVVKKLTPKQLLKGEPISKSFEKSFNGFFKALKDAKQKKWAATSEKAAHIHVDMLIDFF